MAELLGIFNEPGMEFLRNAFWAGLLSSIAFGIMGTFVVVKRISYLAGGISHSVLLGVGLSLFLQAKYGIGFFTPQIGAAVTGILAALLIGWIKLKGNQREDTIIGAVWAVGMAGGLILLTSTPGYNDPMSYLFGNILLVSKADILIIVALDMVIAVIIILKYDYLVAVCFDEEHARIRGINVEFYYIFLLIMISLTIVALIRIAGIILVIALLTIPAAIAGRLAKRMWQMMIWAVMFCTVFIAGGLIFSYYFDLPSGPVIILFAGVVFLFSSVFRFGGK